jgi:hypothetical protein
MIIINMETQKLIQEVEKMDARINELRDFFYPSIARLELADKNLTKCLKNLK